MKNITILTAALFVLAAPLASLAMDHNSMKMGHGDHSMMEMGGVAHQEVINGVKATFKVMSMKEQMKGMELPKGMKETHHIMVEFKNVISGKPLTEGTVKVEVQNPDKSSQAKELMGMQGHFGADFDLSRKGTYGIRCKFLLKDGKVRQASFRYSVK